VVDHCDDVVLAVDASDGDWWNGGEEATPADHSESLVWGDPPDDGVEFSQVTEGLEGAHRSLAELATSGEDAEAGIGLVDWSLVTVGRVRDVDLGVGLGIGPNLELILL
jgi:hypothetical protein